MVFRWALALIPLISSKCSGRPFTFSPLACAVSVWRWDRSRDLAQASWLPAAFAKCEIGGQFGSLLGIGLGEIVLCVGISGKIVEFNHAYTPSNRR